MKKVTIKVVKLASKKKNVLCCTCGIISINFDSTKTKGLVALSLMIMRLVFVRRDYYAIVKICENNKV